MFDVAPLPMYARMGNCMRLKRTQIIFTFGVLLLALFSFQLVANSAMEAGLIQCVCAPANAHDHEDGNTSQGDGQSHPCTCSCHQVTFASFSTAPFQLFVNLVPQGNCATAESLPSDGLPRSIYSPPRLS